MLKYLVYANPYLAVTADGRLCGACPTYSLPDGHTPNQRAWVGAKIDVNKTKVTTQGDPIKLSAHAQDTHWVYESKPVEVPVTADHYYLQRILHGDLIVADAATSKACGQAKFDDPRTALAAARAAAIKLFVDSYGEVPAFASEPCPIMPAAVSAAPPASRTPASIGDK